MTPPAAGAPERWSLSLGVDAHASVGAANPLAPGVSLRFSILRGLFSLSFEARYDAPIATVMEGVPGGEFTSSMVAGALGACVHRGVLRGCAVALGGALMRRSEGVDAPQDVASPYFAGGLRVGVTAPLVAGWSLDLHADLLAQTQVVPTVRATGGGASGACLPDDVTGAHVAVWCPAVVAGVVGAGVSWRLP